MSKGTRLFQATGSPLIQGASKTEKSWMTSFSGAFLIGVGIYMVGAMLVELYSGTDALDALVVVIGRMAIVGVWAGALGAAAGVSVVRAWGARRGWGSGAAVCILAILLAEALVGLII